MIQSLSIRCCDDLVGNEFAYDLLAFRLSLLTYFTTSSISSSAEFIISECLSAFSFMISRCLSISYPFKTLCSFLEEST